MAFNGSGTFQRLFNWVQDRTNGIKVRADRMDQEMDGIAAGLTQCITRDGQSSILSDIPWNNKKITGLADATGATHAMNRQASDERYVRNGEDLDAEDTLAADDRFPFWDDSAEANRITSFSNLRTKIFAPSGTRGTFNQTAAPTGWTKVTDHNNACPRIVSGTVGSGGTADFTTVFAARTISQANLPSYTLPNNLVLNGAPTGLVRNLSWNTYTAHGDNSGYAANITRDTTNLSIGGAVTSGGSGTAMDFAVKYVDLIIATKD